MVVKMARSARNNKQKMFYALPGNVYEVYERNEDGTIKYQEVDGEMIPVPSGERKTGYFVPIEFHASLSGKLNELHAKSYGVDQSSIYSEICCPKGYLPLKYDTKIWKEDEIIWLDDAQQNPDADSATYTVTGLLTDFKDYDWFLLMRNNVQKGGD